MHLENVKTTLLRYWIPTTHASTAICATSSERDKRTTIRMTLFTASGNGIVQSPHWAVR